MLKGDGVWILQRTKWPESFRWFLMQGQRRRYINFRCLLYVHDILLYLLLLIYIYIIEYVTWFYFIITTDIQMDGWMVSFQYTPYTWPNFSIFQGTLWGCALPSDSQLGYNSRGGNPLWVHFPGRKQEERWHLFDPKLFFIALGVGLLPDSIPSVLGDVQSSLRSKNSSLMLPA